MKTNVLCLLKNMDKKDVELQLALQCAPVITGIKVSNLFIIDKSFYITWFPYHHIFLIIVDNIQNSIVCNSSYIARRRT